MLEPTAREREALPFGHPCQRCEVRRRALCSVLDCETLADFKKLGPRLRLSARQTLFREGDPLARVFTLTRGSLKLYKVLPDGRRQIVGFRFAGDFLGISVGEEHAFTATLLEDSELCSFPTARFAAFLAAHPAIEHGLYELAARELDAVQLQLVVLGRKSASERLASFLLTIANRMNHGGARTSGIILLPMSRTDIADFLGLTKETVSRVFSAFRAGRLIRLGTLHEVEIIDRGALERIAESEG
jgi:CRP/FNR family transcriptional regulator